MIFLLKNQLTYGIIESGLLYGCRLQKTLENAY